MKLYVLPRSVERVGEIVAKIPFAKKLLKPIYYPYKDWLNKKRNQQFLNHGTYVLERFDKCLSDNSIAYMLGFGTLLGAIREHGFIKHDLDIDTCMWYDEYKNKNARKVLEDAGFELIREYTVSDGELGLEQTYCFEGVTVDIFMIYEPIAVQPYSCHCWMPYGDAKDRFESMEKYGKLIPYRFETPYPKDVVRVPFNGISLPIPRNYDEILALRYGPDYMTPNPNWKDSLSYFIKWDDKYAVLNKH